MKKLLFSLAMLALPASAFAVGIDCQWNECVGGPLASKNKAFVCTGTVNQTYALHFNYSTGSTLPSFTAINIFLDLQNEVAGPLSPFWHLETGGCQGGAVKGVSISDVLPAAGFCVDGGFADTWDGDGSGGFEGIAAYGADNPIPGRARLICGDARALGLQVDPGVAYWACVLNFNNRNRTLCTGCTQPMAIVWNTCILESNDGTPPLNMSSPDQGSNCATINGAGPATCGATPTTNTTWGAVKALYR